MISFVIRFDDVPFGIHCKDPYMVYDQIKRNAPKEFTEEEKHMSAAEAEGWCELASVGESYQGDFFTIKITEY